MKKEVMKNAWAIAKNAAAKFGGKSVEYIAEALKMAWVAAKEAPVHTVSQWHAVETKMRKAGKYTMADLLGQAKKVEFNEVMHKEGAYYGIEVIADGSNFGTYYIAEKVWA
jgi:hypothetical protein